MLAEYILTLKAYSQTKNWGIWTPSQVHEQLELCIFHLICPQIIEKKLGKNEENAELFTIHVSVNIIKMWVWGLGASHFVCGLENDNTSLTLSLKLSLFLCHQI